MDRGDYTESFIELSVHPLCLGALLSQCRLITLRRSENPNGLEGGMSDPLELLLLVR
jgi:hypothetical protein